MARAAEAVQRALLQMFGGLADMKDRYGAGFAVTDHDGTLLHYAAVGYVARTKGFKYPRVALEKAQRTALLVSHGNGRFERSRDSADAEIEHFQGAVAGRHCVWSITGYTSDVDEAGAIGWGYLRDDIDDVMARSLAVGNAHDARIPELLELSVDYFKKSLLGP